MKPKTREYLSTLRNVLSEAADATIASGQQAYMKDQFPYFGIKTERRRELVKPFLHKDHLPDKSELFDIIRYCWNQQEREFQYFAQELATCYLKQHDPSDIEMYEYMLAHRSWWDTVDMISVHLVGKWYHHYPTEGRKIRKQWLNHNSFWLQRASILYQLKYKQKTDTEWMQSAIEQLIGSSEFFINKAIGWVLREYSQTDADWVIQFVDTHPALSGLSKREALRKI